MPLTVKEAALRGFLVEKHIPFKLLPYPSYPYRPDHTYPFLANLYKSIDTNHSWTKRYRKGEWIKMGED